MAKRSSGGSTDEPSDLRRLLVAAVVELGARKLVGPYALTIPRRALRVADADEGRLAPLELPNGALLLTCTPARPAPKPKR